MRKNGLFTENCGKSRPMPPLKGEVPSKARRKGWNCESTLYRKPCFGTAQCIPTPQPAFLNSQRLPAAFRRHAPLLIGLTARPATGSPLRSPPFRGARNPTAFHEEPECQSALPAARMVSITWPRSSSVQSGLTPLYTVRLSMSSVAGQLSGFVSRRRPALAGFS